MTFAKLGYMNDHTSSIFASTLPPITTSFLVTSDIPPNLHHTGLSLSSFFPFFLVEMQSTKIGNLIIL